MKTKTGTRRSRTQASVGSHDVAAGTGPAAFGPETVSLTFCIVFVAAQLGRLAQLYPGKFIDVAQDGESGIVEDCAAKQKTREPPALCRRCGRTAGIKP